MAQRTRNHPETQPTAVIYTRYSSHSQRDVSIDQQIKECRKFATANGIKIVGIYDDRATTGTNDRRPGFQRMIGDAAKADWDYVIVYTLDRFARNRYDSAVYKRQLKSYGIKVLSAAENISDDPSGILMESVLEGLAEYYSEELSRKIRRGMEDNATKCMVNGSLPLGYVRGEDGRYAIDETEAAVVLEVYRRIREGDPMCEIIRDMNARGIRTKTGKAWSKSSFNRLLTNERYTGVYIYGDVRIPGGVPQIIPQALYDSVQMALHTKKNPRADTSLPQRRRQENGIYYLTGKLFCGNCHSPMVGISGHSKNGPTYYYYTCKGKREAGTCEKKNVNRERIEKVIADFLKRVIMNMDVINALADASIEYQDKYVSNAEVDGLQRQYNEVSQSINNIISAIEAGIFSASTQTRLAELETQKKKIATQLSVAQEDADERLTREEIVAALMLYQNGDVEDQQYRETLFDAFLIAAYVYDNELRIVFNLAGQKKDAALPFDIDAIDFAESSIPDPRLHQIELYEHQITTVVMVNNLFVSAISI